MSIYDVKMIFGASTLLLLNTITLPVALSNILNKIQSNSRQIARQIVPLGTFKKVNDDQDGQNDQNDQDDDTLQSNTSSYTNMIMDSLHL